MDQINMCDLKGQYLRIKGEIDVAISEVIESAAFVKGPPVKKFADNLAAYLNVNHVIPCANGTDALQIALMALELKPGDEVITADFTFIATVEVISLLGLTPVLVDVDPLTYNINSELIEKSITSKTKAIIPVHLFGHAAEMEKIMEIANKYQLYVIEDNAQALGTEYYFRDGTIKKTGTIGHIGCTSFFPTKNLGCFGDGGAICTNDHELAKKMESIANHGMEQRYYHHRIGVNSRLDSIQAAILNVKIKYLDEYIRSRQAAAEYYSTYLARHGCFQVPAIMRYSTHIFHQYTLLLQEINRTEFQEYLHSKGIPTMIYYPVPLHRQQAFTWGNYKDEDFPVTENLCKNVISLPMHTELNITQLKYMIGAIEAFINQ